MIKEVCPNSQYTEKSRQKIPTVDSEVCMDQGADYTMVFRGVNDFAQCAYIYECICRPLLYFIFKLFWGTVFIISLPN